GGYRTVEKSATAAAWNLPGALPKWDGLRGQTAESLNFEALYLAAARRHPEIQFARLDAAEDETQRFFLRLNGGPDPSLLPPPQPQAGTIAAGTPHLATYIAGGMTHGLLPQAHFYAYTSGGVRLRDWVAALAEGKPVADVLCRDCARPELRFGA